MSETIQRGEDLIARVDRYETVAQNELQLVCDALLTEFGATTTGDPSLWALVYALDLGGFANLPEPSNPDCYWSHRVAGVLHWRERRYDESADAYSSAVSNATDKHEAIDASRTLARVLHDMGDPEQAGKVLSALDLSDVSIELSTSVKFTGGAIGCDAYPVTIDDLQALMDAPRSMFRARSRISMLQDAREFASRSGATEFVSAIAELVYELSLPTGLPFPIFFSGISLANGLRAAGKIDRAIEILSSLPRLRYSRFDSRYRVLFQRATCKLIQGNFIDADNDLAQSIQYHERIGERVGAANLLAIRCAGWMAQGNVERSLPVARQSVATSPKGLNFVICAIAESLAGNDTEALEMESRVFSAWGDGHYPAGKTVAHGLRAVLRRDPEAAETAMQVAVHAEAPFVAFAETCRCLVNGESVPDPKMLWGSVAGVALYGFSQQQKTDALSEFEPGLFVVHGKSVDLRRRHAMRKILIALRDNPDRVFDVVDLFEVGWGESPLPTTYADRVYFAIYELRRLGFREWISQSESGYQWVKT